MLRNRVIPCLLLRGNGLVKTVQFKNAKYVGDPINAIKVFNTKEVDELILLDIDASINGSDINFAMLEDICSECFMPLGYGGGINSMEQVKRLFSLGIEKVVINSAAYDDLNLITKAAKIYGSQSIVAGIDAKKHFGRWRVYGQSGSKRYGFSPEQHAANLEQAGAGEIFLNCIERDGTQNGYDINLIRKVVDTVSIPVTVCGGASGVKDFATAIKEGGASGVSAGSMFVFHGKHKAVLISYPEYAALESSLNSL